MINNLCQISFSADEKHQPVFFQRPAKSVYSCESVVKMALEIVRSVRTIELWMHLRGLLSTQEARDYNWMVVGSTLPFVN